MQYNWKLQHFLHEPYVFLRTYILKHQKKENSLENTAMCKVPRPSHQEGVQSHLHLEHLLQSFHDDQSSFLNCGVTILGTVFHNFH